MAIVNKRELTEILEVDRSTLTTWQKAGLPIAVDGTRGTENQYSTRDVIDWMVRREVVKAVGDRQEDGYLDSDQELARLRCAQANKVEIEVALLNGRVLDADEVMLAMGKVDAEVKSAILSMPSRLAPVLIKIRSVKEMTRAIKEDVLQTLQKLSTAYDDSTGAEAADADKSTRGDRK
jgi:phage terminase Nu1 subunit (DNA packaging protein)